MFKTMTQHWKDRRCLVTGASSGLGQAVAEALAREGAKVLLTGRDRERLETIRTHLIGSGAEPSHLHTVACDLTNEEDRLRLIQVAREQFDGLDLLVNSAGVGATGHFETHEPAVMRRVFDINVFALTELSLLALPLLKRGDCPALVNFGSIVARRGLPGRCEYTASKFAIAGWTESIRAEWIRYGIHVLLINPGFTATPFEANLLADTAVYRTTSWRVMTADQVATRTLRAIRRRKNEITLSLPGRLLLLTNRLIPRLVDWGFGRFTLRLYRKNLSKRPPGALPDREQFDTIPTISSGD